MSQSLQHVSRNLRLVSICTVASRVLGLLRDQAMGVMFGAGPVMDAFTVAFRLPNLARVLLGEGALTTAFLPVFVKDLHECGRESAARVSWAVFLTLFGLISALVLVLEAALVGIGWYSNPSYEMKLLLNLTALLLPYVVLICVAAQAGAVLNALDQFLWPALIPAVFNSVWLVALWTIVPAWTDESSRIYVTAICVLAGGVVQFSFPIPVLYWYGFGFRRDWYKAMDRVWKIAASMLPVVVGLSITQLNAVFDSFIAWGFTAPEAARSLLSGSDVLRYPLHEGTATALYLGQRMYQFPLGVFGVALGTVLFPILTRHAQQGESERLRADLSLGLRLVIAIGLPASAGLMLIGHPLTTLFFQYGKFDVADARLTGDLIIAYGSGVWAYCGLLILQRGFYAIGDRLTPMYVGLAAMVVNIVLDLCLIWPLGGRGLAISTAAVAALQCAVSAHLLQNKIGRLLWREILLTTLKTMFATVVMAIMCQGLFLILATPDSTGGRLIRFLAPLVAGIVSFLGTARLIHLSEPWMLLGGRRSLIVANIGQKN